MTGYVARAIPGRFAVACAIILIAFNLRPALSSLAPVLDEVMRDTGLSAAGASIMTTAPVFCMGLFGSVAPWLARRIGPERTALLVLAAVAAGTAWRGAATVPALLAGSLLAGIGIGIGNVLIPALLKRDFADRALLMTGCYTMALCLGAAAAAGLTAPLRDAFGESWAWALAAWAVPAALAAGFASVVWAARIGPSSAGAPPRPLQRVRGLWRDPVAWQVTLYMGLQSALAYVVFGWLAPILRSRGDSAVEAGLVTSVSVLTQVAATLPVPMLVGRLRSQSVPATLAMLVTGIGFIGLLFAPLSWQWGFAVALGLGMGASFAQAVMFIVQRAADSHVASQLSSMSQSVGYVIAAAGPLVAGALHDLTGDWSMVGVMAVVICVASGIAGWLAGRPVMVGAGRRQPG
ncbi:CynX/NimT family MFS transporter [Limobrevibacterium gyesilva]|uniref:MFS transporter n=1 Tax=Limobrevibacterium gyesilva TaxID=2991712 RepID=A0AA42CCU5_9PROT|nr:MFS transporter [Limobrevibacterium gyesilva]MCW3473988.1 MFS transporter [Limobrevibacterium gyesilva]